MKAEGAGRGARRAAATAAAAPASDVAADPQREPVAGRRGRAGRAGRVGRGGAGDAPADAASAFLSQGGAETVDPRAAPPGVHPELAEVDADVFLAAGVTCCPPAVAARIFERLADGESLLVICKDPTMPARRTVLAWIERDPAFAAAYARARDHQADALDDEMAEVMLEVKAGRLDPAAARVWLSGAQWRAAKLAPRRYGDSLNLKHSGGIAAMPIEVSFEQAARTAQAILDGLKADS
jgi:hypothetical protein